MSALSIGIESWKLIASYCSNPHALAGVSKGFKKIADVSFQSLEKAYAKEAPLEEYMEGAKIRHPHPNASCLRVQMIYKQVIREANILPEFHYEEPSCFDQLCFFFNYFRKIERPKHADPLDPERLSGIATSSWSANLHLFSEELSKSKPALRNYQRMLWGTEVEIAEGIGRWLAANPNQLQGIINFSLQRKELTMIPQEVAFFSRLESLDLSYNHLFSLPHSLIHLTRLRELSLNHNSFTTLDLHILRPLKHLWKLELNNNKLKSLPQNFGDLQQLQSLHLNHNALTTLPESLGNLSQLFWLDLKGNQITRLPETLGLLTQLQSLNVANNHLQRLPEGFGRATSLCWLDLQENNLSSLPPTIGDLGNLTSLDLSHNHLQALPEIGNLKELETLLLSYNRLESLPESICDLTKLKMLSVDNNHLSHLPKNLGHLPQLETFYYYENCCLCFWNVPSHLQGDSC